MFLIFDTETTGVPDFKKPADDPSQPRLCSVAACLVNGDGEIVDEFYSLVNPKGWSEETIARAADAFAINGLTMERLRDEGDSIDAILGRLRWLQERSEGVATYGITFDTKMVRSERRRLGLEDHYGSRPTFCVQRAAVNLCKIPPTEKMMASGRKWFKTPNLTEAVSILLGETLEGAHDALADTKATVKLFNYMRQRGHVEWKHYEKAEVA